MNRSADVGVRSGVLAIPALVLACGWLWARNRQLAAMALLDPLTGLPNRRGLERAWSRAGHAQALLFIDLDGFKAINDAYGHAVGDALLRQVARRLAHAAAGHGLLARWGGDEFVAIVPADREAAAMRSLRALAGKSYDVPGHGAVRIGLSIGTCADRVPFEGAVEIAATRLLHARAMRERDATGAV